MSISVSCKDQSVQTITDLLEKLKEKTKETPKGEWIRAWGFNDQKIADGRFPTKEELDSVSTEHPTNFGVSPPVY
jgi:predicted amidohydrolase YtcJ